MYSTNFKIYNDALHESNFKEKEQLHFVIPVPKNNNENLFIYLFIYLFTIDKFTIKNRCNIIY